MFSTLPQSKQIIKLKEELLANMEDKYYELKQKGSQKMKR